MPRIFETPCIAQCTKTLMSNTLLRDKLNEEILSYMNSKPVVKMLMQKLDVIFTFQVSVIEVTQACKRICPLITLTYSEVSTYRNRLAKCYGVLTHNILVSFDSCLSDQGNRRTRWRSLQSHALIMLIECVKADRCNYFAICVEQVYYRQVL